MTTTTIPVRITDEAATHVDKLGLRVPMEQMIEHMKQTVAGLRAIVVTYETSPYDQTADPLVFIVGCESADARELGDIRVYEELSRWAIQTFPCEVTGHLHMSVEPGDIDGR